MDALKLVPQLFYDLISRVVPGGFFLFALSAALSTPLGVVLVAPLSGASALAESTFVLGTLLLAASYVVGQLLAPLSDSYERRLVWPLTPRRFKVTAGQIEDPKDSAFSPRMRRFLAEELRFEDSPNSDKQAILRNSIFEWYDWLRIWDPDAGARAAKVRAEYRMHDALATASLLAIFVHLSLAAVTRTTAHWGKVGVFVVVMAVTTWGMIRTYRVFQWTVMNQYSAAKGGGKGSTSKQ